jgi:hypothetical protein
VGSGSTSFNAVGEGPSPCPGWPGWNNTQATTTLEVLPSTLPGGGAQMIHVTTGGEDNGLYQIFAGGPPFARVCGWVYVNSGVVRISIGTSAHSTEALSTTTGQWELLTAVNPANGSPASEVTIYSAGGAADWYADNTSAHPV